MNQFIIAKPGQDALKANAEDDYVTTKNPILKVLDIQRGSISMTVADSLTSGILLTIPYTLDYKPFIQVFAEHKPGGNFRIVLSSNQTISDDVIGIVSWVQDGSFTVRFTSLGADPTGTYKYIYYLFGDEAESDG